MFCSTIIPTVGRPTLSRAVESVLEQDHHSFNFDVIVVNDSGMPLPEARWQHSPQVQIIHTHQRERSVARNAGATVAKGIYLHFLDDDDWLAPGAFHHFWELSQACDAKWLYGMTQLIDRHNNPTIQLRHSLEGNCFLQTMAGEWIPIQSSLIDKSTFLRIGGFNPLLSGPEDIDLLRRVLLEENIAETPYIVAYVIRGEQGSTTDYRQHSQASRWAREMIIDAPNAFHRMRSSAVSPYWQGRMLRIYLTSSVWNIQHWRPFSTFSRMFASIACIFTAGRSIFSGAFWMAVSKHYASITFQRGIEAADQAK